MKTTIQDLKLHITQITNILKILTHSDSNRFYSINNFITFIFCTILIISSWFITFNCEDVFINQSWIIFLLCWLALAYTSSVLLFYKPTYNLLFISKPILLCFISITISSLTSIYFISTRLALILLSQLAILFFIKLFLRPESVVYLLLVFVANAMMLSSYAILQYNNIDFVIWQESPYKVVATFSNPNYFAAYLVLSISITVGLIVHFIIARNFKILIVMVLSLLLQLYAIILTECEGALISLYISFIILLLLSYKKFYTVRFTKKIYLLSGFLSLILVSFYHVIQISFERYPWHELTEIPNYIIRKYLVRIFEWYMGYKAYLESPLFGSGAGSSLYLLSKYRPAESIVIGLSSYNDDPHSILLTLLIEHGFFGLVAFSAIMLAVVYTQFRYLYNVNNSKQYQKCKDTLTMNKPISEMSCNLFIAQKQSNFYNYSTISTSLLSGIFGVIFHSLFNSSLNILPISNAFVLVIGLHQALVTRSINFKPKISYLHILLLIVPLIYINLAYSHNIRYEFENKALFCGRTNFKTSHYFAAHIYFDHALQNNPQSLPALWGISNCLIANKQIKDAIQILSVLDGLAPNVFNVKYHIAELLFLDQKLIDAKAFAQDAIKSYKAPSLYLLLGKIYIKLKQFMQAKSILEEGIVLVPMWIAKEAKAAQEIYYYLGTLEIEYKNYPKAVNYFNMINTNYFDNIAELKYNLGLAYYKMARYNEALSHFEQAYSLQPTNPKYLNSLGYLLLELNIDFTRAKHLLEQAYNLYKSYENRDLSVLLAITHSLGVLHWKLGNLDKAQELLFLAYKNCPTEMEETKKLRKESLITFFKETKRQIPNFLKNELENFLIEVSK